MRFPLQYYMEHTPPTLLVSTGSGEMPAGFWFVLCSLRVKLAMGNGAVLLFNSAKMAHGTEGPKSITSIPGQVPRMGLAVHCMESVSPINGV